MEDPCKKCWTRKWYARKFDIHFWGEDCPYECKEYKQYKKSPGIEDAIVDEFLKQIKNHIERQ